MWSPTRVCRPPKRCSRAPKKSPWAHGDEPPVHVGYTRKRWSWCALPLSSSLHPAFATFSNVTVPVTFLRPLALGMAEVPFRICRHEARIVSILLGCGAHRIGTFGQDPGCAFCPGSRVAKVPHRVRRGMLPRGSHFKPASHTSHQLRDYDEPLRSSRAQPGHCTPDHQRFFSCRWH